VRGSAGRRSKRSSTFPSMTKTIVGMTTAGMVPAGIGAVMSRTRAPAGAALMAGTAGVAVITPAAMVATALASGMRVLRADALARAALQRRGRRGSNPPSFRRRRGSGAPRFERGRSGIPGSERRRRAGLPWRSRRRFSRLWRPRVSRLPGRRRSSFSRLWRRRVQRRTWRRPPLSGSTATIRSRSRDGQLADCAASVASRVPIASRRSSCAFAAMSSNEGELASSERARRTISALLGM